MPTEMELVLEQTQQDAPVMRMASAAAKPYQGDSSKFYLITGSTPDDCGEVLKLKNFKKDAILKLFKLTNQESNGYWNFEGLDSPLFLHNLYHILNDTPNNKSTKSEPTRAYVRDARAMAATPADVKEFPNAYVSIVDMPGLKSGDIKVQVEDDNLLVISGKRKREEEENVKFVRMERSIGKFMRKFSLPENANIEKISATCQDGVLTLTVENMPPPEPKKLKLVQVQVALECDLCAHNEVACLTLESMTPELQRQLGNSLPYEMLQELKSMFEKQAGVERFDLIQTFHACKQEEGKPVGPYVIKMKKYVAQPERLGYVLPRDLSVGLIMNGLTSDFAGFAATPQVMAIQGGRIQKSNKKSLNAKGKGKVKGKGKHKSYIPKPKNPKPSAKEHPTKDDTCHHCKEVGHCKRNWHAYLAELIKKKKQVALLVLQISSGERKLKHGALYLSMGNGVHAQVEAIGSHDLTIKSLRSDRGDEYISEEFKDYLKAYGIVQQLTPPYRPQHNGVSKRRNHTLLDMVRSMINLTTLPLSFWDYALEFAARILNMVPTKKVDKTPYDLWKRWVTISTSHLKNNIVVARYAEFLEKKLISQKFSGKAVELEEIQDEDTSPSENTREIPMKVEGFEPPHEEEAHVRRSVRTHRAPKRICLNVEVEEHSLGDLNEPTNYKAALLDPESDKWLDAMNAEMQSMKDNQVWRLVDLPPNCKTVGSKWIFKKKTDMNGDVHTYKARLVRVILNSTGKETFSPIADIRAIRIHIAIAAFYDYEIWMKVCKLQRSIYGLKRASSSWNKRFDEEIKRFGFAQNLDEPCVYQKASGSNVTFLILYVDDIIIMGSHIVSLQSVKTYLGKCFAMKDLGETAFILRIKIYQDRSNASTPGEVKRMKNIPYASVVGSIMYAVRCTRPDVAVAQNITSRFQQNLREPHWTVVKTILKYIRNTKDMFLVYGRNPKAELRVDCYCNAVFETDRDEIKSQTRYVFILNGRRSRLEKLQAKYYCSVRYRR
ncbi:retrotransposon protein, putative, ty1-copia subclass [Tanacetum coccineum]